MISLKTLHVNALLFLTLLLILSCSKENAPDCFKSNGRDEYEVRHLAPFDTIEMFDKIEVTIVQGPQYQVQIIAGKNIVNGIATTVSNGLLRIQNNNTCNFVRGYKRKIKVIVTTPQVNKVYNYGVADLRFDEHFKQDLLNVRAENSGDIYINGNYREVRSSSHGNGDIYLNGSAQTLLIYSNGTNYTHAENFSVSDLAYISSYSLGHAYFNLNGTREFQYYIWSEGNIYYKGHPSVINNLGNTEAIGKLISLE